MAKVGFIVDEMFEDSELRVPLDRVRSAGHEPVIIGLEKGKHLVGKKHEIQRGGGSSTRPSRAGRP